MGKVTTTTIKYVCDCCGYESDHRDFRGGSEFGSGEVKIKGCIGAITSQGDLGGCNYNKDYFLCHKCLSSILNHIISLKIK